MYGTEQDYVSATKTLTHCACHQSHRSTQRRRTGSLTPLESRSPPFAPRRMRRRRRRRSSPLAAVERGRARRPKPTRPLIQSLKALAQLPRLLCDYSLHEKWTCSHSRPPLVHFRPFSHRPFFRITDGTYGILNTTATSQRCQGRVFRPGHTSARYVLAPRLGLLRDVLDHTRHLLVRRDRIVPSLHPRRESALTIILSL